VLLIEIHLREGKALGSEEDKFVENELCYEQGLYCV
jgi:hypothetical protein